MTIRPYPSRTRALRQVMRRHRNEHPDHLPPAPRGSQGTTGEYRLSTRR